MPNDFSPDDSMLYYMPVDSPRDILRVPVGDLDATPEVVIGGPAGEEGAAISPNGRWIAYQSDESGEWEVYVRPLPDVNQGKYQISRGGGMRPLWGREGTELFYRVEGVPARIMSVAIDDETGFRPGNPDLVVEGNYLAPNQGRHVYDISPDGERFLVIQNLINSGNDESRAQTQVIVVQNWFTEVQRLAPTLRQ